MIRPRLSQAIERARQGGRSAVFMPFWVLGDPDEQTSLEVIRGLVRSGADIIEVGIPFSDPPADGPVVQAADVRALARGMTPVRALELVAELRKETEIPITLLVYANLVVQFAGGTEGFIQRAAEAGLDAMIVADVPIEECPPFEQACRRHGVGLAQIVTELTSDSRAREIATHAEGYLYVITRLGTTGTHAGLGANVRETLDRLRRVSSLPLFAGFGIASPADVRAARAAGADGVVVGSALVRLTEETPPRDLPAAVEERARALALAAHAPGETVV
jgi:tryptophan synthase alpha chain